MLHIAGISIVGGLPVKISRRWGDELSRALRLPFWDMDPVDQEPRENIRWTIRMISMSTLARLNVQWWPSRPS